MSKRKVHKQIFEEAKERAPKVKEKVLSMLLEGGEQGVTNDKLNSISMRFADSIYRLRLDGHDIEVENLGQGVVKYMLKDTPLKKIDYEKGIEVVKREIAENFDGTVTVEQLLEVFDKHRLNITRRPNGLTG